MNRDQGQHSKFGPCVECFGSQTCMFATLRRQFFFCSSFCSRMVCGFSWALGCSVGARRKLLAEIRSYFYACYALVVLAGRPAGARPIRGYHTPDGPWGVGVYIYIYSYIYIHSHIRIHTCTYIIYTYIYIACLFVFVVGLVGWLTKPGFKDIKNIDPVSLF